MRNGGFYKSFEIRPNPDRLASNGLSLETLFRRVEENNETAGGGYVVHNAEQRFIRGIALLKGVDDIGAIVLRREADGTPILVRDVASVVVAPLTRQGAVTRDGRGEVVIGMVMMLYGENVARSGRAHEGPARANPVDLARRGQTRSRLRPLVARSGER